MANAKISDIANSVALGDNSTIDAIAGEASCKAGMGVYGSASNTFKRIEGSAAMTSGLMGVIKEHYGTGLDTTLTNSQNYEIVTRGKCAVFCDDPGKDIGPGTEIHLSGATAGSFGWLTDRDLIALSGYAPVGKSIERVSNGDTVAKVRLYGQ